MKRSNWAIVVAIATAVSAGHAEAKRSIGSLTFSDCDLKNPAVADVLGAECASLTVPENPADANSRPITLRIGLVPAKTANPEPDPVFFIAGGPGQSALEGYPAIAPGFERIREKRHIVLIDQRGTGGSNKLVCTNDDDESAVSADSGDADAQRAFAERCARELSDHADPRFYTTTVAVSDFDAVRKAMGAAKVNLIGTSYGTRAAQTFLRYFPDSVRTIVLDGVVPPDLALGNEHAKNLESALSAQFERCRKDKACFEAFGDPAEDLAVLKNRLRDGGQPVYFREPQSGVAKDGTITFGHLAATVRMFAYSPEAAALLPYSLNEAVAGRYDALMAQSDLVVGELGDMVTHGMQLSVICSEDADRFAVDPNDASALLGTGMVTMMQAQCAAWPKGERPKDFNDALNSDTPVLLISGEFDPVTPPRYGEAALRGLRHGRHLVARGRGHVVLTAGCMPKLAAEFIDKADAQSIDAACLDTLPVVPAFLNANGWGP